MRKQADEAAALNEKLRAARAKAQFVRPYFARALYALILVLVEDGGKQTMTGELRTMACDKHYRLYASKAFVARADIDTLAACLIHEIGHILRRHFDRFEARGVTQHTAHLAGIAGDCELNDDIIEDLKLTEKLFPDVKLPEWVWVPSMIGCDDHMSMEFYYDKLRENLPPQVVAELAAGDGVPRDGDGNPEPTMPGNDPRGGKKSDARAKSRMLGRFGGQCGSGAHGVPQPWDQPPPGNGGPEGLEDADVRDIERITANAVLEEARRGRGSVPGSWVQWANEIIRPKPIPWEQLAEAALSRAIDQVAGVVLHSYSRPSRRQSAFEDAIMPAMRRPVPFVAMIGDTSGSMSDRDLQLGRGIVTDCCDSLGARIAFVACDAQVHGEVQYATDGTHLELRGRGGTDMREGIAFALTEIIPRPDLLVCWTDGDTPWPSEPPPIPVVALIVRPKEGWMDHVPPWMTAVAVTPADEDADDEDEED